MGDADAAFLLFAIAGPVALMFSCLIAREAGGTGTWGWGVFGPVGWIVAGLRGVQVRQDTIARLLRESQRSPDSTAARERHGETASSELLSHACPRCGRRQEFNPDDAGLKMRCAECERPFVVGE